MQHLGRLATIALLAAAAIAAATLSGSPVATATGAGATIIQFFVDPGENASEGAVDTIAEAVALAESFYQANALAVAEGQYCIEIRVAPGTYDIAYPFVDFDVPNTLLLGEGSAHETRLTATFDENDPLVSLSAPGTGIQGFVVNPASSLGTGVAVTGKDAFVRNCVLRGGDAGVIVAYNAAASITNNVFYGSTTGLLVLNGDPDTEAVTAVHNNIFYDNGAAFELTNPAGAAVRDYNLYYDNDANVTRETGAALDLAPNDLMQDPWFVQLPDNLHLRADSPARDAGDPDPAYNDKDGSRNDMGVDGGPYGNQDLTAPSAAATATPNSGEAPLTVTLDAGASSDEWGIYSYSWDLDLANGIQEDATGETVEATFPAEGAYTVTLTVTDHNGLSSTTTTTVTVTAPGGEPGGVTATATASPNAGPAPLAVQYTGAGTSPNGAIVRYEWDFDADGVYDTQDQNPLYTFPEGTAPGSYSVVLNVTDAANVMAQDSVKVTITEAPVDDSEDVTPDEGGTIVVDDPASPLNGATVDVPPGAVSEEVVVTVGAPVVQPPLPAGHSEADVYATLELGPSGTVFSQPVRVTIPLAPDFVPNADSTVYYYDEATGEWSDAGISDVQFLTGPPRVTFLTTHFTTFGVMREVRQADVIPADMLVTITLQAQGQGTLLPAAGTYMYVSPRPMEVVATPADGWRFSHWEGDVTGRKNPLTTTFYNDATVRAVFVEAANPFACAAPAGITAPGGPGGNLDRGILATATGLLAFIAWVYRRKPAPSRQRF